MAVEARALEFEAEGLQGSKEIRWTFQSYCGLVRNMGMRYVGVRLRYHNMGL